MCQGRRRRNELQIFAPLQTSTDGMLPATLHITAAAPAAGWRQLRRPRRRAQGRRRPRRRSGHGGSSCGTCQSCGPATASAREEPCRTGGTKSRRSRAGGIQHRGNCHQQAQPQRQVEQVHPRSRSQRRQQRRVHRQQRSQRRQQRSQRRRQRRKRRHPTWGRTEGT